MRVRNLLACALLLALSGTAVAQTTPCIEPTPQSLSSTNDDDDTISVDDMRRINDNAYYMPGRCGAKRDAYTRIIGVDTGVATNLSTDADRAPETVTIIPY